MKNFGKRVRAAREQGGFTQEHLAEAIGVSRTTIAKWEAGEKEPRLIHLICLAQILRVSTDYLLGLERGFPGLSEPAQLALEQFIAALDYEKRKPEVYKS